jgi:hypothetical protein
MADTYTNENQETPEKNDDSMPITIDDFMKIIYDVFLRTETRQLIVGTENPNEASMQSSDFLNMAYSILKNVSIRIRCKYCIKVHRDSNPDISINVVPYKDISDYKYIDSITESVAFETGDAFKAEIKKNTDETDVVVLQHILGMVNESIPMYVDGTTITNTLPQKDDDGKSDNNLLSDKIYDIIKSIGQLTEIVYIFVEYVKNQQHITIDKIAVYKKAVLTATATESSSS